MPVTKLSISLAPEVDQALAVLSARTRQAKSALIEVALRENSLVAHYIEVVRAEWHLEGTLAGPSRQFMETIERRRAAKRPSASEKAAPIRARTAAGRRP